jgi:Holliday junction DNA helicase RuvA
VYEYLEGRVASRSAARLVLDVGGVGYDIAVPPGRAFDDTERLRVWIHQVVREDAHLLYGFPDRATRDIFRTLLTVRGVGPAVALGVVSGLSQRQLIEAVVAQDAAPFLALRGIGQRTAEQILLDLRDKAQRLAAELDRPSAVERRRGAGEQRIEDAVLALVSLGYSEKEARKQVQRAAGEAEATDLEHLVRLSLRS